MAVAGAVFSTVMFGFGLTPPALMRRMYCGRRNTPCASAPARSASSISSAIFAASAAGSADRRHRIPDEGRNRGRGDPRPFRFRHYFTPASSFCTSPLSIVTLSSSPQDSALTCRAHSNVPMS